MNTAPDGALLSKFFDLFTVSLETVSSDTFQGLYAGTPIMLDMLKPGFVAEIQHLSLPARLSLVGRIIFGVACHAEPLPGDDRNQLFLLNFEVPRRRRIPSQLVLRLSKRHPFYHKDKILAEVAAMMYVRQETGGRIPMPAIYGWAVTDTLLGSAFYIVDHMAHGVPVASCWDQLPTDAQHRTIQDYARIVHELSHITWDRIGSIRLDSQVQFALGPVQPDKLEPPPEGRSTAYESRRLSRMYKTASEWLVNGELEENGSLASWQRHARAILPAGLDWNETIKAANATFMQLLSSIPTTCEEADHTLRTGQFYMFNPSMNGLSILVVPEGERAGEIVSVTNWAQSGTYPIWRLGGLPDFCRLRSSDLPRPSSEVWTLRLVFISALGQLAGVDSLLYQAAHERWDLQRRLAEVVSLPWYRIEERRDWLREFARYQGDLSAHGLGDGRDDDPARGR